MKIFKIILTLVIFTSCGNKLKVDVNNSNIREEILGRAFSNTEVKSIEIIKIEHPLLGGIISTTKLTPEQTSNFLNDFDHLKKKGMRKCGANYVIRLNLETDTLRLKSCGSFIANRMSDMYYELENNKNIIQNIIEKK